MIHDWIGYFAAVCTTGSLIPQAIKAYRSRKTRDLSWSMYTINAIGVALWLVYGWIVNDTPLFIANVITLAFVLIILLLKAFDGD
ncbi:MAG TPA: SemiSWEET transporter [Verrucomicrobiae bacterium]|nr:SemiSWEET transporter [Verrucomicrobiae bacterium]